MPTSSFTDPTPPIPSSLPMTELDHFVPEAASNGNRPLAITQSNSPSAVVSKSRLWTGRVLTALVALFLLLDAAGKLMMPVQVVEAFSRLGFPVSLGPGLGVLLLVSTLVYLIPRTAVLGVILLTGFFGGAVAIQLRAGSPLFETLSR